MYVMTIGNNHNFCDRARKGIFDERGGIRSLPMVCRPRSFFYPSDHKKFIFFRIDALCKPVEQSRFFADNVGGLRGYGFYLRKRYSYMTRRRYGRVARALALHLQHRNTNYREATREDIRAFLSLKKNSGLAAGTMVNIVCAIHRFYRYLHRKRPRANYMAIYSMALPKVTRRFPNFLHTWEMQKLLDDLGFDFKIHGRSNV